MKLKFRGRVSPNRIRYGSKEYVYVRIALDAESSRAVIAAGLVGAEVVGVLRPVKNRQRRKETARAAAP